MPKSEQQRQRLESLLQTQQDLLFQYQQELGLESDPRRRQFALRNIEQVKAEIERLEVELARFEAPPKEHTILIADSEKVLSLKKGFKVRLISYLFITSIVLIIIVTFVVVIFRAERGTVYFVVDASENVSYSLSELAPYIKLNSMTIGDNTEIGLAVFGGGIRGEIGCSDITPLVELSPKQKGIPLVSDAVEQLTKIRPKNYGGLQRAISFAIDKLTNHEGTQEIVVITSKVDSRCEKLDKAELDKIASQKGVKYRLRVATIGSTNETDQKTLSALTNGGYTNLGSASELPNYIQQTFNSLNSSYDSYNYYYRR